MDNVISDITDEMGEIGRDAGKKFVKDVVKGVPKAAKKQVVGTNTGNQTQDAGVGMQDKTQDAGSAKMPLDAARGKDPVTGKPVPSKKVLSDLKNATTQVAQMKLKQIREELEKQRLKIQEQPPFAEASEGHGPEVPAEPEKPKEDVVAMTLKQSKSTGEFGKNIGG